MAAYTFKHGDRPLEGITIQRAVGRGGFGEVYYALSDAGKQLAVKFLRDNPDIEMRGINIVMNLKSPHLITIYDVRRSADGELFVVMEYISGPSLRDIMNATSGGMAPEKAVFFINGIAQGLSYLHDRGIVHRDMKPGNIFYDDGYVKIGDYGLSKHISVSAHSGQTVSVGTVHYMAPEIGSGNYSKAIDVYSMGVMLYEMLTGKLPFTGKSMGEILMRHLNDDPDTSGLPAGFGPIVAKAMAKDPNERYQDVDQMVDALARLADVGDRLTNLDPSVFSDIPRDEYAHDDPTRTSPHPGAARPDLDARRVERTVQRVGDRVARIAENVGQVGVADRIRRKAEQQAAKIAARAEAKARKIEGRYVRQYGEHAPHAGPAGAKPKLKWRTQLLVILMVAAAVSIALAMMADGNEELVLGLFFLMVGGVFGTLFAHFKLISNMPSRHWFLDRVIYASSAAVFSIIAFAALDEARPDDQAFAIAGSVLAAIFVCDWGKRIESGRRGKVDGGLAIWPGIVGLIAGGIMDGDDCMMLCAAVAALVSLLTQAAAAMWPYGDHSPRRLVGIDPPPPIAPAPPPVQNLDARDEVFAPPPPPPPPPRQVDHRAAAPQGNPAAQPSFAGRRKTGENGFGKLLIVIGLTGLLLRPAFGSSISTLGEPFQTLAQIGPLRTFVMEVPHSIFLFVGCLLVVLARRVCSAMHLIRGLLACVLLFWAATTAFPPAMQAIGDLHAGGLLALRRADAYGPLVATGLALIGGFSLLKWPDRDRNQVIV